MNDVLGRRIATGDLVAVIIRPANRPILLVQRIEVRGGAMYYRGRDGRQFVVREPERVVILEKAKKRTRR